MKEKIKNIILSMSFFITSYFTLIYLMSVGNESKTYLRGLEVAELKEEELPMF